MELRTEPNERLSRLAWCARIDRDRRITVQHGRWVETGPDFFIEGAWDGRFSERNFPEAMSLTGSGAVLRHGALHFAAPTHLLDRLQAIRRGDSLFVSNSLPLLLAASGDDIDPGYVSYEPDLLTIVRGVRRYTRTIPAKSGARIRVFYFCNFSVDAELRIRERPKTWPEPFADFEAYRGFLRTTIAGIASNAQAAERRTRFEPLTTISAGYDSPTCAALARDVGCTKALTFRQARPQFEDREDSGRPIAERLGLEVVEFDREFYRGQTGFPEAEFLANGTQGEDVHFVAFSDHLPRKLLFLGFQGDPAWGRVRKRALVTHDLCRQDPSGASLTEFRLRTGFMSLVVPFLGLVQFPSIYAISNAAEMKPYALGTRYDRPICRRILSEAGVPNELFGQRKRASSQPFHSQNLPLAEIMTPESHADFERFTRDRPLYASLWDRLRFRMFRLCYKIDAERLRSWDRWCRRRGRRRPRGPWISDLHYARPRTVHLLTFHWAFEKTRRRYAEALGRTDADG